MNELAMMLKVPGHLRSKVIECLDEQLPIGSGPNYAKMALVLGFLERQEASGQWMQPFIPEMTEWWGSDRGTSYENILKVNPGFNDSILNDDAYIM